MATYSARALPDKAYDELEILDVLLDAGTAPWIFGFHAQQIAEMSLEAVVALRERQPSTSSTPWQVSSQSRAGIVR
jgi:hypothetical protein